MWLFKQTSTAAKTVLIYITVGALIVVWTVVWRVYLWNNPPAADLVYYWCNGFMVTGLIMVLIGLVLGRFGRSNLAEDLTPEGVVSPQLTPAASPLVIVNPAPAVAVPAAAPAPAPLVDGGGGQDGPVVITPAL